MKSQIYNELQKRTPEYKLKIFLVEMSIVSLLLAIAIIIK